MPEQPAWRDHDDRPVAAPAPPAADAPSPYAAIGDFQGHLYRRNAFALGTEHEASVLADRLHLRSGDLVVDVGCGDARHLRALARRGVRGIGVDVSAGLLAAARAAAREQDVAGAVRLVRGDARRLPLGDGRADAVLCLCQGGFGTAADDAGVLRELARLLRPGGRLALTAFHALAAVRSLVPGDAFDPERLVLHHVAEVVGPDDQRRRFDLWTSCHTVPGLRAAAVAAGLEPLAVVGCAPGRYDGRDVGLDDPELLLIARAPG